MKEKRPIQLKIKLSEKEMKRLNELTKLIETTKSNYIRQLIKTQYNELKDLIKLANYKD